MNVHIIGGSGFLGTRVVRRLVARGDRVAGLARSAEAAQRLREAGAEPVEGDLLDPQRVAEVLTASGADLLITSVSLGLGFGENVVTAAERAQIGRGVFVSSTSIFTTLSSESKSVRLAAEEQIRASSIEWTIVRPTMIYGAPDDRNMARLLRALRRWRILPLPGGGSGLHQPVHVDDLADLLVTASLRCAAIGSTYEAAGPEPLTFREVVRQAGLAVGVRPITIPIPLRLLIALATAYERLSRHPRLRAEQLERLAEDKAFDIAPARRDLGFDPRPFAEGIREEADLLAPS